MLYNLGKKMRLNVMPSCGYATSSLLASAAELALPLAVTSEVERYSRVAFLTFCVVRDAILCG